MAGLRFDIQRQKALHRAATAGCERNQERDTHNIRLRHEHRRGVTSDGHPPPASGQSTAAGDAAYGPRSTRDAPSTNGPDIWDTNHDGTYTCDEWKSYLDRLFTLADRNRDGHLDPPEFAIIRRTGTAFAEADFGYFDENQDGKITRSEFVDKPSEFILRYDKNSDCRVTQDEMKGASTDQKQPKGRGKKF